MVVLSPSPRRLLIFRFFLSFFLTIFSSSFTFPCLLTPISTIINVCYNFKATTLDNILKYHASTYFVVNCDNRWRDNHFWSVDFFLTFCFYLVAEVVAVFLTSRSSLDSFLDKKKKKGKNFEYWFHSQIAFICKIGANNLPFLFSHVARLSYA